MQFEYTAMAKPDGKLWYDLSLIDCINTKEGCPGHEGGFRAVGGDGSTCKSFTCRKSEPCNTQAYIIPENGYQPNAPVGVCSVEAGVVFELCAMNRVPG
jgi:hypothetical protein